MICRCTNVFDDIHFNLPWASDYDLSKLLNNYYSFYEPIYTDVPTMKCKISMYLDIWRDYLVHWWDTMNYSYDPIENYSMVENGKDTGTSNGDVTNRNYSNANNESKNINGSTSNASDSSDHYLTRSGNIGVTTSQQMIQSERDLISNINLKLIHIFEPLFYFTL